MIIISNSEAETSHDFETYPVKTRIIAGAYLSYINILGITNVVKIHPLWNMNVCFTFHGNEPNMRWDISLWTTSIGRTDITTTVRLLY